MKRFSLFLLASACAWMVACSDGVLVTDPISASSPEPSRQITRVSLDDTQKGYVDAGNGMAFRFLREMWDDKDMIVSPLSLQYALAMAANGASGDTLQEIIDFLGYGEDGIVKLNAYCKTMLEQLPAVDLDVKLKLTDALLVNDSFTLNSDFRKTVQSNYYAAVESMDFSDPSKVAGRINEWAKRSTNGFIDKLIEASEISDDAVAFIMNALYFKAQWEGNEYEPMFRDWATKDEDFMLAGGAKKKVPMMQNTRYHRYAEMDGYRVLALPYAGGKFFMYILLPDKNELGAMLDKLAVTPWKDILSSLKQDAEVRLKLPKFDIENKFSLNEALQELGIKKAFVEGVAEFNGMFANAEHYAFWISKVIQKAKISVAEWGTEAAAVTVIEMDKATAIGPGEEPKVVYFYADHPFAFVIGEATSGTILFEGTFTGK